MKVPVTIRHSCSLMSGDALIEKAYEGMIALMDMIKPDSSSMIPIYRWAGDDYHFRSNKHMHLSLRTSEFLSGLINGVYMPGTERAYWCGNFDVGVDELTEEGCVYCEPNEKLDEQFAFAHIRKMGGFPETVYNPPHTPVAYYRVNHVAYIRENSKTAYNIDARVLTRVSYFSIASDGSVWVAHDKRKLQHFQTLASYQDDQYNAYHFGPGALSLLADRKFLWLVETSEPLLNGHSKAKMQFGVDAEMVKSLFYARDIPITATGRLRPILHWVEAHKRRVREGLTVGVIKHLRGIEEFSMGGLEFKITQPKKPLAHDATPLTAKTP